MITSEFLLSLYFRPFYPFSSSICAKKFSISRTFYKGKKKRVYLKDKILFFNVKSFSINYGSYVDLFNHFFFISKNRFWWEEKKKLTRRGKIFITG